MAINTLATADIFMRNLDKIAMRDATTGWMDANAGQVIYNGGATVKIPKMTVQGLGVYDRDNGYAQGSVGLTYETYTLTQDRGRKFHLDAMDVDETNFVATASQVMAERQTLLRFARSKKVSRQFANRAIMVSLYVRLLTTLLWNWNWNLQVSSRA